MLILIEQSLVGDVNEKKNKKAQTLNVEQEDADEGGESEQNKDKEADAYQHVKQANQDDVQVKLFF